MINLGKKWFGGGDADGDEDFELRLDTMRIGDLLDYDLKTWEVTGLCAYDYDGFPSSEWQLTSRQDVRFLERAEEDGQVEWSLTRSIDYGDIQEDVATPMGADEDPPPLIHFDSRSYKAVESSSGVQTDVDREGSMDENQGREFVSWSYESEDGRLLFLLRWGETRFSAYEGESVEAYSFTDILPGADR
jgi:hypothetical protein